MQPFAAASDIWLSEEIVTRLFADGRQVWQSHIVPLSDERSWIRAAKEKGKEKGGGGARGAEREVKEEKLQWQRLDRQIHQLQHLQRCVNHKAEEHTVFAEPVNVGHGDVEHFWSSLYLKRISLQLLCTHRGMKDAQSITPAPFCLIEVIDAVH